MKQSSLHYDFLLLNPSVGEEDISCLHPLRTQSDFLTGMLSAICMPEINFFYAILISKNPRRNISPAGAA